MKIDYRVICCIVAWLCCTTVECHEDRSNLEGNNTDDYGTKYDVLDRVGKTFEAGSNDTERDERCDSKCGVERLKNGVKCISATDGVDCLCEDKSKGFDHTRKICKACDCGVKGSDGCSFEGDKKICKCKTGFSQDGDACEDDRCKSKCGEDYLRNAIKCLALKLSVICVCTEKTRGFDYKEKTCKVCNCGDDSRGCSLQNGQTRCYCNAGFAQKGEKCEACNCGASGLFYGCSFEDDKKTCRCEKGFAQYGDVCEDVRCNSTCGEERLKNGVKCFTETDKNGWVIESPVKEPPKCICEDKSKGYDFYRKNCSVCSCGDNSTGCSFKNGQKTCSCKPNFAHKGDKCEVCNCGYYSDGCSFEGDKKICKCNSGYTQSGGVCEDEWCDSKCGVERPKHGVKCTAAYLYGFDCVCEDSLKAFNETEKTCKACDCGDNSSGCKFFKFSRNNIPVWDKRCNCSANFGQKGEKCEACDCGDNSVGCIFFHERNEDNKLVWAKRCKCNKNSALKGENCETCDCGDNSNGCSFFKRYKGNTFVWEKRCKCNANFAQKREKCEAIPKAEIDECAMGTHICSKNTTCMKIPGDYICMCKPGYRKNTENDKNDCLAIPEINHCALGTHKCPMHTTCLKVPGDYICICKKGYSKNTENDKKDCLDMCSNRPCVRGTCSMKKGHFNCQCPPGYGGSRCDLQNVNYGSANESTIVVGIVLGTILIVVILAILMCFIKRRGGL